MDLNLLIDGVREGRVTFANTLKYVLISTSANFGNMFSMAGASLLLPFLLLVAEVTPKCERYLIRVEQPLDVGVRLPHEPTLKCAEDVFPNLQCSGKRLYLSTLEWCTTTRILGRGGLP